MEEKIEVGEYGRTNYGKIIKFAWIERSNGKRDESKVILIDGDIVSNNFFYFHVGENIVKHSKRLIDLIEVEDIVNGYRVENVINEEPCPSGKCVDIDSGKDSSKCTLWENDIKTILTKEQMIANCYKVGGENENRKRNKE